MDISFKTEYGKFNFRVCALIISDGKILAMRDEHAPYYYLPGGRVEMGETAENALLRELKEELEINAKIIRPVYLNQAFFKEAVQNINYHEICLYYLMDVSATDLLTRGNSFTIIEGKHTLNFEWLKFEKVGKAERRIFRSAVFKRKNFRFA